MKAEVPLREKLSLYWLARHKPYVLVIASGLMLGASFPPSPCFFLIFFAFVPLFFLMEAVPRRVPEDKVMLPFKKLVLPVWRLVWSPVLILLDWKGFKAELARSKSKGESAFKGLLHFLGYHREYISGNAQLFRYTYLAFLIWNLIGCYWLSVTAVGAENVSQFVTYLISGIFAVMINPALMAIPFQFFSRIRHQFSPVIAAALGGVLWIAFEYLHFRWELSWAWLTLGHALTEVPSLIQIVEFSGVLGLTVYIWGANVLVYFALKGVALKGYMLRAVGALAWILLPLLLNVWLMNPNREVFQSAGTRNVRIVQPNVDPFNTKFDGTTFTQQVKKFARQIEDTPLDTIDLVLLPETAVPRPLRNERIQTDILMKPLWEVTKYNDVALITGITEARRYRKGVDSIPSNAWMDRLVVEVEGEKTDTMEMWIDQCNSALIMSDSMTFDTYQKSKLVPMVERTPWLDELAILKHVGINLGSQYVNLGLPDTLKLLQMPDSTQVGVIICYESEFGDFVRHQTQLGAELFVIITNDGWWGNTSGHVQHAGFSSLRAVENRRAIARCANTGTSLFADVYGNLEQKTSYWEATNIDQTVNLYRSQTYYVRHGDYLGRFALVGSAIIILMALIFALIKRFRPDPNPEIE